MWAVIVPETCSSGGLLCCDESDGRAGLIMGGHTGGIGNTESGSSSEQDVIADLSDATEQQRDCGGAAN